MIRPLKWGTLRLWTPTGSKMANRQSWKNKKPVHFSTKTDVFFDRSTLMAGMFGTTAQCSSSIEGGRQKSFFGINEQVRGPFHSKSSVELIFDNFGEIWTVTIAFYSHFRPYIGKGAVFISISNENWFSKTLTIWVFWNFPELYDNGIYKYR